MKRALLSVTLGTLLAGCGGGGSTAPVLEETAQNLDRIESAVLSVSVRMKPMEGDEFGYEIEGPVRLGKDGEPPVADVQYTQIANGEEDTVRLVLQEDGGGYVERDGQRIELDEGQLEELLESGSLLGGDGLKRLSFERWVTEAELSDGPDGTDKVTGELDVAAAMAGLAALSGLLQQNVVLTAEQRQQVADAVEESSFEVLTGKEDRLLRKLALEFTLETDVPEELRDVIGEDAVGADFSFDLELDDVNEPVRAPG